MLVLPKSCSAGCSHNCFECGNGTCLEQIPVASLDLDREGTILRVNSPFCQLLGSTPSALIGRPVWELTVPEEEDLMRRLYARRLRGELPLTPFDRVYFRTDGTTVTAEVHETLMRSFNGEVVGMRSAMVDVSTRVRREAELRSASEFGETLIGALPDGLIAIDNLGTVVSMNRTAELMSGRSRAECCGLPLEQVLAQLESGDDGPGCQPRSIALVRELLESKGGVLQFLPHGASQTRRVEFSTMLDRSGAVTGFLAILR